VQLWYQQEFNCIQKFEKDVGCDDFRARNLGKIKTNIDFGHQTPLFLLELITPAEGCRQYRPEIGSKQSLAANHRIRRQSQDYQEIEWPGHVS